MHYLFVPVVFEYLSGVLPQFPADNLHQAGGAQLPPDDLGNGNVRDAGLLGDLRLQDVSLPELILDVDGVHICCSSGWV